MIRKVESVNREYELGRIRRTNENKIDRERQRAGASAQNEWQGGTEANMRKKPKTGEGRRAYKAPTLVPISIILITYSTPGAANRVLAHRLLTTNSRRASRLLARI
ncbi:hypothetical protein TNCV_3161601 [Trichonephila clavipes]|nr:hypothetical protein TNCV_3161601 [Trichonephila clavipes]